MSKIILKGTLNWIWTKKKNQILSLWKRAAAWRKLRYRKTLKILDPRKLSCNTPKIQIKGPNLRVFLQKDSNGIANSENPDQTAPLGAVWSGSALFAKTYLSENLGLLRFVTVLIFQLSTQRRLIRLDTCPAWFEGAKLKLFCKAVTQLIWLDLSISFSAVKESRDLEKLHQADLILHQKILMQMILWEIYK